MITVGVLSDTHIHSVSESFQRRCQQIFERCSVILHAGDLTDISILEIFAGKEVHAVHGNMCNGRTGELLPTEKQIILGGYHIGITHGAGPRHNIEDRVFEMFPDADCIVYGHTHIPVCHKFGETLMINPGSFQTTGKYGAQGSYGILEIDVNGLRGAIHYI